MTQKAISVAADSKTGKQDFPSRAVFLDSCVCRWQGNGWIEVPQREGSTIPRFGWNWMSSSGGEAAPGDAARHVLLFAFVTGNLARAGTWSPLDAHRFLRMSDRLHVECSLVRGEAMPGTLCGRSVDGRRRPMSIRHTDTLRAAASAAARLLQGAHCAPDDDGTAWHGMASWPSRAPSVSTRDEGLPLYKEHTGRCQPLAAGLARTWAVQLRWVQREASNFFLVQRRADVAARVCGAAQGSQECRIGRYLRQSGRSGIMDGPVDGIVSAAERRRERDGQKEERDQARKRSGFVPNVNLVVNIVVIAVIVVVVVVL
ncbi:hypothetical protein CDD83_3622 [Cordyceps sp. RAO-2017]|nr:hypothetical protein CDD83_3622 [Cordyceps sp. RAO-2017]